MKVNGAVEFLKIRNQLLEENNRELSKSYVNLLRYNNDLYKARNDIKREYEGALEVIHNATWFI